MTNQVLLLLISIVPEKMRLGETNKSARKRPVSLHNWKKVARVVTDIDRKKTGTQSNFAGLGLLLDPAVLSILRASIAFSIEYVFGKICERNNFSQSFMVILKENYLPCF